VKKSFKTEGWWPQDILLPERFPLRLIKKFKRRKS